MLWQMGQVAEAAILDPHPGLVGWWRFDEGSGTVATDSSGHGNDGTIYGAISVDGKYDKALSFDGTDDLVSIPHDSSLDCSDGLTVEAWIYPHVFAYGETYTIISKQSGTTDTYKLYLYGRTVCFRVKTDETGVTTLSYSLPSEGTYIWYQLVGTYEDGAQRLYVDGSEVASDTPTGSIVTNTQAVSIGRYGPSNFLQFDGLIDDVRVYNRALFPDEIEMLFQKGPEFSSRFLAKVPKGTTQFMVTLSWQGLENINITIESPSENYTEEMALVYQRTAYSSSSGNMLNIKRVAVSVTSRSSDENWYVLLESGDVEDYRITVEIQR